MAQVAEFHTMTVAAVEELTAESVVITFDVPTDLEAAYRFTPGQHVIVRADVDGKDVRRSYSICTSASSGELKVAVKHLPGGVFSSYATSRLAAGDRLAVTLPTGEFTIDPDPRRESHYVAVAAGSGITPIMAMISSVLEIEPESRFTLIFGNRDGMSVMFLDELDALKGRYLDRLVVMHVLSGEGNAIPLFEGRLDMEKLERLFATVVDVDTADGFYLCGPLGMVEDARKVLATHGVPETSVHDELFFAQRRGETPIGAVDDAHGSSVRFTLTGRTSAMVVDPSGAPILDHALRVRPDAPFSCRSGACASCRAVIVEGEVEMDRNWCLSEQEVAAGQILTCQSHPVTDTVEITYDI